MRKWRFGIVGSGKIVDWVLAGAAQDPRFEAVAICSRTQERADEFARAHGLRLTFTNIEDMAASPDIDAVYVATPNSTHASYAVACMNRGKHVLCEKPLAGNAREAELMVEASRRNGVCLMEAMIATMTPNFEVVRSYLPRLGTLRRWVASYCQYSSRYDRLKQGDVANAFKPELCNGALMDIGTYTIYPMVALLGLPECVCATGVKLGTGVDGQGAVTLSYAGGLTATVLYSKIANSYLPTEIEGEDGNLLLDGIHFARQVTYIPRPEAASGRGAKAQTREVGVPITMDDYYYEVKHFLDLLDEGSVQSPVNSHRNSIATLQIMDEVRRQIGLRYPCDE